MLVKVQFFKYGLCTVLYFVIYIVLIELKRNFSFHKVLGVKNITVPQVTHASIIERVIKKDVELEIKMLRIDELKGGTIDLQKSANLLRRVSDTCVKRNLTTPLIKRHFLYNAKHKSLYCWIRKAASTSFTKLFSDMSNRHINHNFYREVDFLSPETIDLQRSIKNRTIFKLLVVRHPFHRLVSSYRDRIEDNSRYTAQAGLYAYPILYFSRPNFFHSNVSQNGNILRKIFSADRRLKIIPSFREFLTWLLRQPPDHDDVHWAQYHTHCAICNVSYNFILKLDEYTLGEVNYVLSKLKLGKKTYLPVLQRTQAGLTNFDVTCRYFRNLTTSIVMQLYERYKIDFEMYDYNLDKYLQCATKNSNG